jgi:4-hydroxy-tetrahydrodipicolinate reductase
MIKIGLLGYGQMGSLIERMAPEHHLRITEIFDENRLPLDSKNADQIAEAVDVFIDFSVPEAVIPNIRFCCALGKAVVVGTTGWFDSLEKAAELCGKSETGLVYAPNFSLGVNLFYRIAEHASSIFNNFLEYDVFLEESHHKFKKDAPSGTALHIKKILENFYPDTEIPTACTRAGYIPGTHKIGFDSKVDTVSLFHEARSREGFALGAILAAKWIYGRKGFFAFSDVIDEILSKNKA